MAKVRHLCVAGRAPWGGWEEIRDEDGEKKLMSVLTKSEGPEVPVGLCNTRTLISKDERSSEIAIDL